MIEFYPQIKAAHIHLVLLSVGLFALRGGFSLIGAKWPRHAVARYASYTIDTCLLTSAAMLLTILPGAMFANGWLTAKMLLLVAYIVLGVLAMRVRFPRSRRAVFFALALLAFFAMFGIARMHHPWGWLARWLA
ncbi:SirB2 family protein [Luteimonas sp. e5]